MNEFVVRAISLISLKTSNRGENAGDQAYSPPSVFRSLEGEEGEEGGSSPTFGSDSPPATSADGLLAHLQVRVSDANEAFAYELLKINIYLLSNNFTCIKYRSVEGLCTFSIESPLISLYFLTYNT